jgi:hypothetical protein
VQDRCDVPPLLSHDGNPFPPGLKPIRFDFSPGGFCPVGLPWKEDLSRCERVTEFRYVTVPEGWPVLPLYIARKGRTKPRNSTKSGGAGSSSITSIS